MDNKMEEQVKNVEDEFDVAPKDQATLKLEAKIAQDKLEQLSWQEAHLIDFETLIRFNDPKVVADKIVELSYLVDDFMKKDAIDRFLEFVFFKIQTGYMDNPNLAYPTKRMIDEDIEKKVIVLINEHLMPEIIIKVLKVFSRNVHDSDSNLYIANLINSDIIIKSIFDTFKLFKKDIFKKDLNERAMNVKRIQQYSSRSDNKLSSPLDAVVRLKYILEFFMTKMSVSHIYTKEDLNLSA
ncbi:hypothetical protein ACFL20_08770 [Spirochaetota bacterium]